MIFLHEKYSVVAELFLLRFFCFFGYGEEERKLKMKKKTISLILSLIMILGILPLGVLAEDTPKTPLYLKSLAFGTKQKVGYNLDSPLESGKFEYTVTVPIESFYIAVSYVHAELDEKAPAGSEITVDYTSSQTGKEIIGAKITSMLRFFRNNDPTPDVIKINVGTESDKQVFTIKFIKEIRMKALLFKDSNDATLFLRGTDEEYKEHFVLNKRTDITLVNPVTEKDYSLDVDGVVKFIGNSKYNKKDDVCISINGQQVKEADPIEVKPVWDNETKTGIFTIDSQVGTEDISSVRYTVRVRQSPDRLAITKAENKQDYLDGSRFNYKGLEVTAYYRDKTEKVINLDECTISPSIIDLGTKEVTIDYYGCKITQPITVTPVSYDTFDGKGTEAEPYLIKNQNDLRVLSALATKDGCIGKYFKMVNDITLPDDWTPIGGGLSIKQEAGPFTGVFDGDNHLLTVPKGGLPLFGFTRGAVIKNLNIFGEKINGYGLINNYNVDYGEEGKYTGEIIKSATIQNVTLKSGSKTLKAGFIGGYASGINAVYIDNCTIEKGVTIGYDKSQSNIGGFGGEYNGYITNSKCYADIYGVNFVGGIVADKGQTMGPMEVKDCIFGGTVNATGNYVGGISGAGYGGTNFGVGSAPNTPCISIINCDVTGEITGKNYVGGILGAEPGVVQCWSNGSGIVKDNIFSGKINATEKDAYIGGTVAYINSVNKLNVIESNYYIKNCGAQKGIGFIKIIDTNNQDVVETDGVVYLNTEGKTEQEVAQMYPGMLYPDYNRTDDPVGKDAEKLSKAFGVEIDKVNDLSGNKGEWTGDSGEFLKIHVDAPLRSFINLLIDGTEVSRDSYFLKEGSIVIELKPEYLSTLSVGRHSVTVVTNYGKTNGEINIFAGAVNNDVKPSVKKDTSGEKVAETRDTNNLSYVFVALASGIGACSFVLKKRKGEK